jgi:hypothetical protein
MKNLSLILIFFLGFSIISYAQPGNDDCATATNLPCATTNLAGATTGATNTAHGSGCSPSNYGVWYSFAGDGQSTTITSTGLLDNNGSGFDQEMTISSGSCGGLTNLACENATNTAGDESYTFTSVVGTTYYVYIADNASGSNTTGTFTISRTCTPPPPNDLCANATNLPCGTTNLPGTAAGASNIPHGTTCSPSDYGVWYSFAGDGLSTTITSSGGVDGNGSAFDHEMTIVSGSCGAFNPVTCQNASASDESYTFTSTIGTTYYVYIAQEGSTSATDGSFTISRSCTVPPPAPPNDDCANSTTLTMSNDGTCNSVFSTVYGATNSAISACGGTANDDVWFSFVATNDTAYIIRNADFDSEVEIFDGCSGTSLGCQDNEGSFEVLGLTVGNTYFIRIHSFGSIVPDSSDAGFDICVIGPEPPTNVLCSSMQPICSDSPISFLAASGGTDASVLEPGNNYGCLSTSPNPTWFYLEIDTAGTLQMGMTANSDIDFALWGPYSDLPTAQANCGTLPAPIDCSYSTSGTEDAQTAANVGDVFVLLITNYADVTQPVDVSSGPLNTASTNCSAVLPVTLSYFNGENIGNKNILKWTTSTEINNDYFVIEASKNSLDFNEIGRVIGAGNSNQLLNYKFEDNQPLSDVTYYRLKQVDFDGQFEYSHIIAIKTTKDFSINIYPNPSKRDLYFDISSTRVETVKIIYTDVIGNIHKEFVQIEKGANTYQTNEFNNLSKGIYFVRIMNEKNEVIKQEKVIKQ